MAGGPRAAQLILSQPAHGHARTWLRWMFSSRCRSYAESPTSPSFARFSSSSSEDDIVCVDVRWHGERLPSALTRPRHRVMICDPRDGGREVSLPTLHAIGRDARRPVSAGGVLPPPAALDVSNSRETKWTQHRRSRRPRQHQQRSAPFLRL